MNAISTIARAAVTAPPMKIATKLLSIGTPAVVRASRTATSAAAVELPIGPGDRVHARRHARLTGVDLRDDQRGQRAVAKAM